MKKKLILALAMASLLALVACTKEPTAAPTATAAPSPTEAAATATPDPTEVPFDPAAKSEGVMTYAQYIAAEVETDIVIECYVQATQSWYKDAITVYAADPDGAYFIYNLTCSEEDAKKLVPGTKIKVTGSKTVYNDEIEVAKGATFVFEEGKYVVETPVDLTEVFAASNTDELKKNMNVLFSVKDAKILASKIKDDDTEYAWLYKWNGAGEEGDDLYFNVEIGGVEYTFTVESYLCGADTEVYKAVKALKVGDTVDLAGFLYWFNGANPHITSVKVK